MKLATALSERADLQRRIQELGGRLNRNAKVQEGEKPSEDPNELLEELNKDFARLEELIARINHTNNVTKKGDVKKGMELFLQFMDIEIVVLDNYKDVYEGIFV